MRPAQGGPDFFQTSPWTEVKSAPRSALQPDRFAPHKHVIHEHVIEASPILFYSVQHLNSSFVYAFNALSTATQDRFVTLAATEIPYEKKHHAPFQFSNGYVT